MGGRRKLTPERGLLAFTCKPTHDYGGGGGGYGSGDNDGDNDNKFKKNYPSMAQD